MTRPAARLAAPALVVLLASCGSDGTATTTTTTTAAIAPEAPATRPEAEPVETVDASVLAVDPDSGTVQVRRAEAGQAERLALDEDAEVTVQGPDGPLELGRADLDAFVDRRRVELGGTQDGVAFVLEVTGRGANRRVTALREIPPG